MRSASTSIGTLLWSESDQLNYIQSKLTPGNTPVEVDPQLTRSPEGWTHLGYYLVKCVSASI
eukprot:880279-Pyramimonas_sp.AAC.1